MLNVEELTFTYPGMDRAALAEVSCTAEDGQVLGLLGPVGSGRTTLCLSLSGLAPRITGGRSVGDMSVDGLDPRDISAQRMAQQVGVVFQDQAAQITQVSVADEVAAPLVSRGYDVSAATAHARSLLDYVGVGTSVGGVDAARKRTWELSAGQQQRIAIAAVLAMDPQVIVFDNAAAPLDPGGRHELARMIRELAETKTVVVVEDADFLAEVADRVLVLADGRVVAQGPAGEVLRDAETLAHAGVEPSLPLRVGMAVGTAERPVTVAEFQRRFSGHFGSPALAGTAVTTDEATSPATTTPEPVPEPSVDVRQATHRYKDGTAAIRDVTLAVGPGEVHAVAGGNGAGKTTLIKHMAGLLKPSEGRVLIGGTETGARHVAELATSVGTMLQNPDQQITERTVRSEVGFPLRQRQYERVGLLRRRQRYDEQYIHERVVRACAAVGLDGEFLDRDVSLLPHAQRRLVTIAEALVCEPAVVVLDEPSAGLDAATREQLRKLIGELALAGTAVVLIEHDMDLVCELADEMTVLAGGSVALQGPVGEVFAPQNRELLASLAVEPSRAARLAEGIGLRALTRDDLITELRTATEVGG